MARAKKSSARRPARAPVRAARRTAPRRSAARATTRANRSPVVRVVLERPAAQPMMSEAGRLVTPVFPGKAKF